MFFLPFAALLISLSMIRQNPAWSLVQGLLAWAAVLPVLSLVKHISERRTAMIKRLDGVTIWSEDLNNLLPFYRDVLGLKVGEQAPGFAVLGERDAPALRLGTHSEVHGRNADPARHMVSFDTDDLSGDWKRLKAAGVEFIEDPTDYGGVWIATLKDPEGNLIQLFQGGAS